jgi:hypothetical protein
MKISLRLAIALLPVLLLAGCNLFNAPAMEVRDVLSGTVIQNSGSATFSSRPTGWYEFEAVNVSYRTITFTGSPRVQISNNTGFDYSDTAAPGHYGLPATVSESSSVSFYIDFKSTFGSANFTIPTDKGNFYFSLKY